MQKPMQKHMQNVQKKVHPEQTNLQAQRHSGHHPTAYPQAA